MLQTLQCKSCEITCFSCSKMRGEVKVHSNESLNFLLVGNCPIITSRRPTTAASTKKKSEPAFDLTGFPPPITNMKSIRPKTTMAMTRHRVKKEPLSTAKYSAVHNDEQFLKTMESNLGVYADNHQRKIAQIHHDWEERYMTPFNDRLKSQLSGKTYNTYKLEQTRNLNSTIDGPSYSTLSYDRPISVPTLRVSVSGLRDRVHNATLHVDKERELTEIVNSLSNDTSLRPKPMKALRPPEEVVAQLSHTRFYDGDGTCNKNGRKAFKQQFTSTVGRELDHY